MGGNSATKTEEGVIANSAFPGQANSYTMPAMPPGMMEALAAQMTKAYGGDQASYLAQLYQPMTFKSYQSFPGFAAATTGTTGTTGTTAATETATPTDTGEYIYDQPYDSLTFQPNRNRR